jgi:hypothetical protein
MTRRKKILLLSALALAMCALVAFVVIRLASLPPDPVAHGKKLSYWLGQTTNDYPSNPWSIYLTPQAVAAIAAMDTNALPRLWHELNASDDEAMVSLQHRLHHLRLLSQPPNAARLRKELARQALRILGRDTAPLIPQLIPFTSDSSWDEDELRKFIINDIGTNAIPFLTRCLTNEIPHTRLFAARCLFKINQDTNVYLIHLEKSVDQQLDLDTRIDALRELFYLSRPSSLADLSPRIAPILIRCLEDREERILAVAAHALHFHGTNALRALPQLFAAAAQTNYQDFSNCAQSTLNFLAKNGINTNLPPRTP